MSECRGLSGELVEKTFGYHDYLIEFAILKAQETKLV
jgi:hypothetical protein